jgi:hypothetical protein
MTEDKLSLPALQPKAHERRAVVWAVAFSVLLLAGALLACSAPSATPAGQGPTPAPTFVALPPTPAPTAAPITLVVAHTNDTWGYLFPCG